MVGRNRRSPHCIVRGDVIPTIHLPGPLTALMGWYTDTPMPLSMSDSRRAGENLVSAYHVI